MGNISKTRNQVEGPVDLLSRFLCSHVALDCIVKTRKLIHESCQTAISEYAFVP